MNLILHGVMVPRARRHNTLEDDIRKISDADRFDVILTNPPFGGTENALIQHNFPIKSNATELLFLEHIMKKLKPKDGARCGVVVPEGTLFRNKAFTEVRKELLTKFRLFMVVSLPQGAFAPYSDVKTALLFFERPGPTTEVLYHELPLPENLKKFSKGSLIADANFAEALHIYERWKVYRAGRGPRPEPSPTSWIETYETLAAREFDLSAKNPYRAKEEQLPHSFELTARILERQREFQLQLEQLHKALSSRGDR